MYKPLIQFLMSATLCGWYLMFPPNGVGYLNFRTDAPLSQWNQIWSGDTAKECQAQGEKIVVSNKMVEASPNLSHDARKLATNTVVQSMDALCIASDDPRLEKRR